MESSSILLLVLVLLPVFAIAVVLLRKYGRPVEVVASGDLPLEMVASRAQEFLDQKPPDGSFIAFLTDRLGNDGGASFTQVSIEGGRPGIDHVFTVDLNRRTGVEFERLLESEGQKVVRHNMNDVDYLRAETPDGPRLAQLVLKLVLGLSSVDKVSIIEEIVP